MENKEREIDLIEMARKIWADKRKLLKWGLIAAVIGLVVAFSIPKQYETTVKMALESSSNSSLMSSMGGLAAMAGLDVGGNREDGISGKIYPEIIHSSPFLLELADIQVANKGKNIPFYDYITLEQRKPWWSYILSFPMKSISWIKGLFSEKQDEKDEIINIFKPTKKQHRYIDSLNKLISVEIDKKKDILRLTCNMQDPVIAAVIADSLTSNLQQYMTGYRTKKTREDLDMNSKRLEEARKYYYMADSLYADAIDRNKNLISQSAQIKLDRLLNEKNLAFSIYQQLATQVEAGKVKLQEETPIATIIEPASIAIRASSPNKSVILVIFIFLGVVAASGTILVKQFFNGENES